MNGHFSPINGLESINRIQFSLCGTPSNLIFAHRVKSKTYSVFKLLSVNFFQRIIGKGLLLPKTINLILETQNCKNTKIGWHRWNLREKIPQNSCTSWYNLWHNNYVQLEMDFCPLCGGVRGSAVIDEFKGDYRRRWAPNWRIFLTRTPATRERRWEGHVSRGRKYRYF